MEVCLKDHYRDVHTGICLPCSSVCATEKETDDECQSLCPDYGITSAPQQLTTVSGHERHGNNHMTIIAMTTVLILLVGLILVWAILMNKYRILKAKNATDYSWGDVLRCSPSQNKLETLKTCCRVISCSVEDGSLSPEPEKTKCPIRENLLNDRMDDNSSANRTHIRRENELCTSDQSKLLQQSVYHQARHPTLHVHNNQQQQSNQRRQTTRNQSSTIKHSVPKVPQQLTEEIDINKDKKTSQILLMPEVQKSFLNNDEAVKSHFKIGDLPAKIKDQVPSGLTKQSVLRVHANSREMYSPDVHSNTYPKMVPNNDFIPLCLHKSVSKDKRIFSHSNTKCGVSLLQKPIPMNKEVKKSTDSRNDNRRPQSTASRLQPNLEAADHQLHETRTACQRNDSSKTQDVSSGYNTTSSPTAPYSGEHRYLLEGANADAADFYDGIAFTNTASEDNVFPAEIQINLVDNQSQRSIGQRYLSEQFSMATLQSHHHRPPSEQNSPGITNVPSTGSTFTSSNHWNNILSLYDILDKQKHKFPWIVGCMISNDHIEVVVNLKKADCSLNEAYDQLIQEISTDREEYLLVTADQSGSYQSHRM